MTTALINEGEGYAESDVMHLEKGEVDCLMLVGGTWARLEIQTQIDDGAERDDGQPQFRPYSTMYGPNSESCTVHMYGPIDYIVIREKGRPRAGCNIIGQNA